MKLIDRVVRKVDNWQRRHRVPGFLFAVVKKYGEDEASYKGALITYYGFLSLFPLLLVATSILQLVLQDDPALRSQLIGDITRYFPVVGQDISESVGTTGQNGLVLAVGLIITLFGARGAADAWQHAMNNVWQVPRTDRPGFPKGPLKSLALIGLGGLGLISAAVLSGVAAGVEDATWFRIVPSLVSIAVLFGTLLIAFHFGLAARVSWRAHWPGALGAAIMLQILQLAGYVLLTQQLQRLSSLYGTFAIVLGILAWIYLQAQVLLYASEVNSVLHGKLWPRALDGERLNAQDREAFRSYASRERFAKDARIRVEFPNSKAGKRKDQS